MMVTFGAWRLCGVEKQIPPLRCGMTTKKEGGGEEKYGGWGRTSAAARGGEVQRLGEEKPTMWKAELDGGRKNQARLAIGLRLWH